jgi:hypothetical protein
MQAYLDLLRQRSSKAAGNNKSSPASEGEPLAPLIDRLKRLIAELSPEAKQQSHPLEFFAERLRGRIRATPNRGELGRCLSALGYTRIRCWREPDHGFRALWHPPLKGIRNEPY